MFSRRDLDVEIKSEWECNKKKVILYFCTFAYPSVSVTEFLKGADWFKVENKQKKALSTDIH